MGRRRPSRTARAFARAACASVAAAIMLLIDHANPVARINVPTICLAVLAVGAWLAWLIIRYREITELERRLREQHAERRFRNLLSTVDSDR